MRPSRTRYITACQQLLALGAVLAVLTPAATVISLDVVQRTPHGSEQASGGHPVAHLSAYTREAQRRTLVPTAPVEAEVDEYPLTAAPGAKVAPGALSARTKIGALGGRPGGQRTGAGHGVRRRGRDLGRTAPASRPTP